MNKLIFVILALLFVVSACDDPEVFTIGEDEEIARLINESYEGRELFMTDGFAIPEDPYMFPGNDTTYRDVLDSMKRDDITINIPVDNLVIEQFGDYNYAEATISDKIFCTRTKTLGSFTETTNFTHTFKKKAFLLKLGSDNQKYSGWTIAGIAYENSIQPTTVDNNFKELKFGSQVNVVYDVLKFTSEIGDFSHTDTTYNKIFNYFPLDSVSRVNNLSILNVTINIDSLNWIVYSKLITNNDPFITKFDNATTGTSNFVESFTVEKNGDQYWHLLNFTGISKSSDSLGLHIQYHNWFVPYRFNN